MKTKEEKTTKMEELQILSLGNIGEEVDLLKYSGIVGTCKRQFKGKTYPFYEVIYDGKIAYMPKNPEKYFTATGEWKGWLNFIGVNIE